MKYIPLPKLWWGFKREKKEKFFQIKKKNETNYVDKNKKLIDFDAYLTF